MLRLRVYQGTVNNVFSLFLLCYCADSGTCGGFNFGGSENVHVKEGS